MVIVVSYNNTPLSDILKVRIQALEWVQGQIQDIIPNNGTTDWPVYEDRQNR
ncbi:MAG: hypothetical protein ACJ71R_07085 [Nitrososphaeraceae archaeon]